MVSSLINLFNSFLGNDGNKNFENFEFDINLENYFFVVVLDIGIIYFGYVFSSRDDFKL